jgi:cytochrome c553
MPRPVPFAAAVALLLLCALPAIAGEAGLADRVQQCSVCHGEDGNSRLPNIPSLAGQPAFFLLNQLILMREGVRRVAVMAPLVAGLTDAEIEAIAAHFAGLEAKPSGETVDPTLAERGAALAVSLRCASCHLPSFAGQNQMPRLAKQRIDYMIEAMKALRDDKRSGADTMMTAVIVGVPDADLAALAHYVASR